MLKYWIWIWEKRKVKKKEALEEEICERWRAVSTVPTLPRCEV